jgi:hypothetical protein
MAKNVRCYLGFHCWQTLQAEGGGTYKQCQDCEKFKNISSPTFLPGGT